jgi:hypothetical protein
MWSGGSGGGSRRGNLLTRSVVDHGEELVTTTNGDPPDSESSWANAVDLQPTIERALTMGRDKAIRGAKTRRKRWSG